jgi:hypothetical protein
MFSIFCTIMFLFNLLPQFPAFSLPSNVQWQDDLWLSLQDKRLTGVVYRVWLPVVLTSNLCQQSVLVAEIICITISLRMIQYCLKSVCETYECFKHNY